MPDADRAAASLASGLDTGACERLAREPRRDPPQAFLDYREGRCRPDRIRFTVLGLSRDSRTTTGSGILHSTGSTRVANASRRASGIIQCLAEVANESVFDLFQLVRFLADVDDARRLN